MIDYNSRIKKLASVIDRTFLDGEKVTLLFGNGFHYLPFLEREETIAYRILELNSIPGEKDLERLRALNPSDRGFRGFLKELRGKHKDSIAQCLEALNDYDRESYVWQMFEYWRMYTGDIYHLDPDYASIAYLLQKKMIDNIAATNYDLLLECLFQRCEESLTRNPCVQGCQWNYAGYYSQSIGSLLPIFWKLHGDIAYFGWASVDNAILCDCVGKLHKQCVPHPFYRSRGERTLLSRHYHDYGNFERSMFQREIEEFKNAMRKSKEGHVVISLGFAGHWDSDSARDDELSGFLADLARNGRQVFMIVSPSQYIEEGMGSHLWKCLDPMDNCIQPQSGQSESVPDIFEDVLKQVPDFFDFEGFATDWCQRLTSTGGK